MTLFSQSKLLLVASCAFFSLAQQTELLATSYSVSFCRDTDEGNCNHCKQSYGTENGPSISLFGTGNCANNGSNSYCDQTLNAMFINNTDDNAEATVFLDQDVLDSYYLINWTGPYRNFKYNNGDGGTSQINAVIDADEGDSYYFSNKNSNDVFNTIEIRNTGNQFGSDSTFIIYDDIKLQVKENAMPGVETIVFRDGWLSLPDGLSSTYSYDFEIDTNYKGYLSGGTSDVSLDMTNCKWTGIDGAYNETSDGVLILGDPDSVSYSYIKPGTETFYDSGGGSIIIYSKCTVYISNSNDMGYGENIITSKGGTLKFFADMTLENDLSFAISPETFTIDPNGYAITLTGDLLTSSSYAPSLQLNDNTGLGSLGISTTSFPSELTLIVNQGTLSMSLDSGQDVYSNITLNSAGTLNVHALKYHGAFVANGGTIVCGGNTANIYGAMSGTGSVSILRTGDLSPGLYIHDGASYTGTLKVGEDTGEVLPVYLLTDNFGGNLEIYPCGIVTYEKDSDSGSTSYMGGGIKSAGIYVAGESSFQGATLKLENTTTGDIVFVLNHSITGNLYIEVLPNSEDSSALTIDMNTDENLTLQGCLQLPLNTSISHLNSDSKLILETNQSGTTFPRINGNITYSTSSGGDIYVNANSIFGSSDSSYPTIRFGSLTLSSGILSIYSADSLGNGSGTLIGNGGTLNNESSDTMTLTNPWKFEGGTTTTFEGGGSSSAFNITGSIATQGAGSATISSPDSGGVTLNPSSLTLATDTSLLTNGNSITTGTISGSGGLVLGGGGVDATLTINSTSSYSGSISNGSRGNGIVYIQAPVTFSGANTFSGGLHLESGGTLTINTPSNLGDGTIYFNTGGLTLPLVGTGETVTASNSLNFTGGGSTTVFTIAGSTSGYMNLNLTGNSSITTSGSGSDAKTANLEVTGGGILTIGTTFDSGSTYNVSVTKGALVVNSETITVSSARPYLNDGILRGSQDSWFSLADASYANWGVIPVSDSPPTIMNVTVSSGSILAGSGEVTTVVMGPKSILIPGVQSPGNLTVTNSLVFETNSAYAIRSNGSSVSLLTIGGDATIETNVGIALFPLNGNYSKSSHVILTAGNLVGKFDALTTVYGLFLDSVLDYSVPNEIILSIDPRSVQDLATGANAIAVANALDEVIHWNRTHVDYDFPSLIPIVSPLLPDVFASLAPLTTEEEMTDALNQLQPAFFKGFTVVQENNIVKVQDALTLRMDSILQGNSCYAFQDTKECCAPNEKRIHAWISGLGDVLAQESNTFAGSPQVGYQGKTYGFATGVDGTFAKFLYAGAMGGYTSSYIKWRGHQGTGNINTGYVGLYLSAIGKMFYGNLSLIGGFSDMSSKRHIEYTGVDLTASGNHSGKQLLSHADTGINFSFGGFTIKPFDAFDYVSQTENSYVEKGAGQWRLSLKKSNAILLRNELGLEVSTCLCFKSMKWVVAPKASWVREVRVKGQSYTASFTEAAPADAPFTVTGYFPDRSLFSPGISLAGSMCQDKLSVELNYQGEFTHGYSDHSYGAEVRVSF